MSREKYENSLYEIYRKLVNRNGFSAASRLFYPVEWYAKTDRFSLDDMRAICNLTGRQQTTIAKRLEKSGSVDDLIASVIEYLRKI